ncbi:hypothetical protein [Mycoplasma sp. CSL7503-lung]|uniref:hypothetical protein n=1 Tax=Mycoplasma sp. CSL7503-lung TaxID=536372 RepID=UPI0021D1D930|nr:hypothetical protein [Mycoplasma sp. CSL7503-lung]MCU4706336.1 hypothetical protein [Mycoplasma sp. CSL7503-lung]
MKKIKLLTIIPLSSLVMFSVVACSTNNKYSKPSKTNSNDQNISKQNQKDDVVQDNMDNIPDILNKNNNSNNNNVDEEKTETSNDKKSSSENDGEDNTTQTDDNKATDDIEKNSKNEDVNTGESTPEKEQPIEGESNKDNNVNYQLLKVDQLESQFTTDSAIYNLKIENYQVIYQNNSKIFGKLKNNNFVLGNVASKNNNILEVTFKFNDLSENTEYQIEEIRIENGDTVNNLNTEKYNFTFRTKNIVSNDEEIESEKVDSTKSSHLSNKKDSDRVSYRSLQSANEFSANDEGIKNIVELTKESLKFNESYKKYFDELNNQSNDTTQKEDENITYESELNFSEIERSGNNTKFTLNNDFNISINNPRILIKSWNENKNWSKWVNANLEQGNKLVINNSDLDKRISKYVVTALETNNKNYLISLNGKNIIVDTPIKNLEINNFNLYKDESNKNIFGSISLNWDEDKLIYLKDKIFVLTFEAKQKVYQEKSHTTESLFGPGEKVIENEHEKFDDKNRVQKIKRVYVPFDKLWKFNLNGLQEQIQYKLSSLDIVSNDEYINVIDKINYNTNSYFNFNFNWNNDEKLSDQLYNNLDASERNNVDFSNLNLNKKELFENNQTNKNKVPFSINNLSTLINYNYEVHNLKSLYKNRQKPSGSEFVDYKIIKNNVEQSLHWFKTRDYLAKQPFKITKEKDLAIITKDLNSIVNLNQIPNEDVIFWITFEFNPNPQNALHWSEFNDVNSRVTIPVSYKNILNDKVINDVDFMYNLSSENNNFQSNIASKIRSLVSFNLELSDNNILKLKIKTRNNDVTLNNTTWEHNSSSNRSIYLNTADLFVYWIQPKTSQTKALSFKENEKLDELSIQTSATAYNDTYELKEKELKKEEKGENEYVRVRNIENHLVDSPKPEEISKRLFKEDVSKGIQEGRSRAYSLSNKSDGTWNIFAKVNDDPNDYRFWTFSNYHVWVTLRSENANMATISKSKSGNEVLSIAKGEFLAPTLMSKNVENKNQPVYYKPENIDNIDVNGNAYNFDFSDKNQAIKYEMIVDFTNNNKNIFDKFKNNMGIEQTRTPENENYKNYADTSYMEQEKNRADLLIAIVDFEPIFKKFEGKDLSQPIDGKVLTIQEKNAINHVLNFKNLKPLKISKLSRYINSFTNLNAYISSIPKVPTLNPYGDVQASRYREYLYGVNSIKVHFSSPTNVSKSFNGAVYSEVEYFDLYSGSSGSAIYDYNGDLLGLVKQGTANKINNFIFVDTQKYSYFGNDDTIYNPGTFRSINKKLSYLYPTKYKNIFDDNN